MGNQENKPTNKPNEEHQGQRAVRTPREKGDRASNPERPANQDPQFDPSHIQR